jgi:hypothetical protein
MRRKRQNDCACWYCISPLACPRKRARVAKQLLSDVENMAVLSHKISRLPFLGFVEPNFSNFQILILQKIFFCKIFKRGFLNFVDRKYFAIKTILVCLGSRALSRARA